MDKKALKTVFLDTVPVLTEYLFLGMGFGILLSEKGFGLGWAFCMKDVSFTQWPHGIPELIGVAIVAVLHIWKRNSLLSIGVGTVCYMLLVQLVF